MSDELPPSNLILQALHAIRAEGQKTNEQLAETNQRLGRLELRVEGVESRLDETNKRIDTLREFTVQGLTSLNKKMDQGFTRLSGDIQALSDEFNQFLTGER